MANVFPQGANKICKVPVDVDPAGLSCQLEVFLSPSSSGTPKSATSGMIPFSSTGSRQVISAPITMPSPGGQVYKVLVDLYAEGYYLAGYIATEDVIVPSGTIEPPIWE